MSGKLFEGVDFSGFETLAEMEAGSENGAQVGNMILPLASVIEDPNQPRTAFDDEALKELAASIKKRGVVQPIIVRPENAEGKHVIVMGARRYRASLLAGKGTIPVVVRVEVSDGYDQMIENIQREALSHQDIARFIRDELAKGAKQAAIASGLGKPRTWVSLYVNFFDMDTAIQEGVEAFGMRTAYELHAAMQVDPEATRAFIAGQDSITQRAAREFSQSLRAPSPKGARAQEPETTPADRNDSPTGKRSRQDEADSGSDDPAKGQTSETRSPRTQDVGLGEAPGAPAATNTARYAVMVKTGERIGRLILDHPTEKGSNFGTVALDGGSTLVEIALKELEIIEIVKLD